MSFSGAEIAFLFPGQGAQFVGMANGLLEKYSKTSKLLSIAEQTSGLPITELVAKGPISALTRTEALQPALTAVCIAASEYLLERGVEPGSAAGHSLGEYPALVCAGVLRAEDALEITSERGRLMAQAPPGAMTALVGKGLSCHEDLLRDLLSDLEVVPANFNSPDQVVISGRAEQMDEAVNRLKSAGLVFRPVKLNVSGAWHSPLLEETAGRFAEFLDKFEFKRPARLFYSNVTGESHDDPIEIKELMKRQLISPVRWTKLQESLFEAGLTRFVEPGPGSTLRGLLRRTHHSPAELTVFSGCDPSGLDTIAETWGRRS